MERLTAAATAAADKKGPSLPASIQDINITNNVSLTPTYVKVTLETFIFSNKDSYMLPSFANRNSAYLLFRGFSTNTQGAIYTRVYYNEQDEKTNYLASDLGSLASNIFPDGTYYVYGVRSYLKITTCSACRSDGGCTTDHLLQGILRDIHSNMKYN